MGVRHPDPPPLNAYLTNAKPVATHEDLQSFPTPSRFRSAPLIQAASRPLLDRPSVHAPICALRPERGVCLERWAQDPPAREPALRRATGPHPLPTAVRVPQLLRTGRREVVPTFVHAGTSCVSGSRRVTSRSASAVGFFSDPPASLHCVGTFPAAHLSPGSGPRVSVHRARSFLACWGCSLLPRLVLGSRVRPGGSPTLRPSPVLSVSTGWGGWRWGCRCFCPWVWSATAVGAVLVGCSWRTAFRWLPGCLPPPVCPGRCGALEPPASYRGVNRGSEVLRGSRGAGVQTWDSRGRPRVLSPPCPRVASL